MDPLQRQLERMTERIRSARVIARAIIDSRKSEVPMPTPKLDGLQFAFERFNERIEAAAGKLIDRMDRVVVTTETAVEKFGGAIDKVEATASSIDNAANQLTNGGPPLAGSPPPPKSP